MCKFKQKSVTALLILGLCICAAGCSKSKRKFKMPSIKMVTSEYIIDVDEPEPGKIWFVGDSGVVFHSLTNGETWEQQPSGTKNLLCDIEFINGTTGWITGIKGTLLHTEDGGFTWTHQKPGTDRHLLAGAFVNEKLGWVIGDFATVLHTTDGGETWVSQHEKEDRIFSNVFFTDARNGWIVGERGTILHTVDGGDSWAEVMPDFFKRETLEEEYTNPRPGLFGVCFTDRDHGWICGVDSVILHTADGGKSWKVLHTGEDILFNIRVRGNRGWAVGSQGTYLISRDGGLTWQKEEELIKSKLSFANVNFSSEKKGWITGASGTLLHTTDGGETWAFYSGLSYEFEGIKMPEALEKRIIE